ncbi:hypothetical protein GGI12_001351 [Dipsacomyces acuminosporus]|nr:hypothetical protein GGI12_001351 [Dipsacomyces acuminosporus]
MIRSAILAVVAAQAVNAQFKFDPMGYNASELYNFISAKYPAYASAWDKYLSNAKASYTGAYPVLTSFLGAATIPATFDPAFASKLAEKIYSVGPTTIVDPAVNPATLVFTRTSPTGTGTVANTGTAANTATATNAASTPAPTKAVSSPTTDTDVFILTPSSTKNTAGTTKNAATHARSPNIYVGIAAAAVAFAGAQCLF